MKRVRIWRAVLAIFVLITSSMTACAEGVAEVDLQQTQQWVQQHLVDSQPRKTNQAELQVWACNGGLLRNGRAGKPLTIVNREYPRGLLAQAPSKLVVQLASPAKAFSAIVGLDSNEATRPGLGSVVFTVTVGGKVIAQSPVLREGMKGVPLQVELGGATRFVLETTDAGDGISSDHADWAAAKVVLANGKELWLDDFYPLTAHSLTLDVWAGWQFDRPEMGAGIVQTFRRDESPYETARFKLRGLEPEAMYRLHDFDQAPTAESRTAEALVTEARGSDLMGTGLLVRLPQPHASCIIRYQRVKQ